MKKQEKSQNQNFYQLVSEFKKKYEDSSNYSFFLLGLIGGQLLGINGNILYDMGKELPSYYFEVIVSILTLIFLFSLYRFFRKTYLNPLKKIINELKRITQN